MAIKNPWRACSFAWNCAVCSPLNGQLIFSCSDFSNWTSPHISKNNSALYRVITSMWYNIKTEFPEFSRHQVHVNYLCCERAVFVELRIFKHFSEIWNCHCATFHFWPHPIFLCSTLVRNNHSKCGILKRIYLLFWWHQTRWIITEVKEQKLIKLRLSNFFEGFLWLSVVAHRSWIWSKEVRIFCMCCFISDSNSVSCVSESPLVCRGLYKFWYVSFPTQF